MGDVTHGRHGPGPAGRHLGEVGASQGPARNVRRFGQASDLDCREAVDVGAGREPRALLDHGAGAHDAAGAEHAAVTDDGAWFDDGPGADATAMDHRPGADDHSVVDDEIVVG